jgi:regulator of sigma E protease
VVSFDGEPVEGSIGRVLADMVVGQVRTVGILRDGEPVDVEIPEHRIADMLNSPDFMTPRMPFVVAGLSPGDGAEKGGMMPGDSLVAVDGAAMIFYDQFVGAFGRASGSTVPVTVMRDSSEVRVLRVLSVEVSAEGKIGVYPKTGEGEWFPVRTRDYTFAEAVPAGFREAGDQISSYWQQLKLIVSPKTGAYKQVGSLITIGNIFPGTWNWLSFWSITAFISIALAVMNILPIPALDGGHTLFLLWEVVTRRRPSDKFLEHAQMVGLVLVLLLLVLTFGNDIYRFFIK